MKVSIIGTRKPVRHQFYLAAVASNELSKDGFDIFTTGSRGICDTVMMNCPVEQLTVIVPWRNYGEDIIPIDANRIIYSDDEFPEWRDSVFRFHSNPSVLSKGAIAFHACSFGIVKNSSLVIAFPESGGGGDTGRTIRIAKSLGIPVISIEPESALTKDEFLGLCARYFTETKAS